MRFRVVEVIGKGDVSSSSDDSKIEVGFPLSVLLLIEEVEKELNNSGGSVMAEFTDGGKGRMGATTNGLTTRGVGGKIMGPRGSTVLSWGVGVAIQKGRSVFSEGLLALCRGSSVPAECSSTTRRFDSVAAIGGLGRRAWPPAEGTPPAPASSSQHLASRRMSSTQIIPGFTLGIIAIYKTCVM